MRQAKRDAGIPQIQQPTNVEKVPMKDRNGKDILDKDGRRIMTTEYTYKRADGSEIVIQDHSAGHQYPGGVGDQGPHINVRPKGDERTGKVEGTEEHYSY